MFDEWQPDPVGLGDASDSGSGSDDGCHNSGSHNSATCAVGGLIDPQPDEECSAVEAGSFIATMAAEAETRRQRALAAGDTAGIAAARTLQDTPSFAAEAAELRALAADEAAANPTLPGGDGASQRRERRKRPTGMPFTVGCWLAAFLLHTLCGKAAHCQSQAQVMHAVAGLALMPFVPAELREWLPLSYDQLEAQCRYLGFPFPTVFIYHACTACDTLFRGASKDDSHCSRCQHPRTSSSVGLKSRKYHYFSVCEFIHNLYSCKSLAAAMRSRPTGANTDDGCIRDFWDSDCYKQLLEDDPDFAADARHVILFMTADGVMCFKKDAKGRKGYSVYPIACGVMNLPAHLRSLPATTHLVGICPGPNPHQLQSYLAPFADEMAFLGAQGTEVVDAAWCEGDPLPRRFRCKAKLVIVTADLRAATKLEPNPSSPAKDGACLHCDQPGFHTGGSSGKVIYPHAAAWSRIGSAVRSAMGRLNPWNPGSQPNAPARYGVNPKRPPANMPPPTVHDDAARRRISTTIGHTFELPPLPGQGRRPVATRHATIFSELHARLGARGWRAATGLANDAMHTIGGVAKNLFDLVINGSRVSEAIKAWDKDENKKWVDTEGAMPLLTQAQKELLEQRLASVAAVAPYTLRNETFTTPWSRPTHISTHGYFALTGPIGKYALAGMLPAAEEQALFGVLDVCNALWQREFTAEEVAELNHTVAQALAKAEQHLPASETDMKMHNVQHLAQQVKRLGPLWTHACWVFERLYGMLVRYIRNTAYPTASMASGHSDMTAAVFGRLGPLGGAVEAQLGVQLAADVPGFDRRQLDADGDFLMPSSWLPASTAAADVPVQAHGDGKRIKATPAQLRALHLHYCSISVNAVSGKSAYEASFDAYVTPLLPAAAAAHQPQRQHNGGLQWPAAALDHWLSKWVGAPRASANKHSAVSIGGTVFKHPRQAGGGSNPADARFMGRRYDDEPTQCWFGEIQEVWTHVPPPNLRQQAVQAAQVVLLVHWFKNCTIPGGLDAVIKVPSMATGWDCRDQFVSCDMVAPTPIVVLPHYSRRSRLVVLHRDGKFYESFEKCAKYQRQRAERERESARGEGVEV